jgi:predicted LPLAT superfamily acyltransferase
MLNRVALERGQKFSDIVLDFVPDADTSWPDLIEVSAKAASIRVRLRLHVEEIEVVAIAFDSAMTAGDGELYYRPKDSRA